MCVYIYIYKVLLRGQRETGTIPFSPYSEAEIRGKTELGSKAQFQYILDEMLRPAGLPRGKDNLWMGKKGHVGSEI